MIRIAIVLFALLVAACDGPARSPVVAATPEGSIVWPEPPLAPKIRYLHGFRGPEDLGIGPGAFRRFWEAIVGGNRPQMLRPYAVSARGRRIAVADPGLGAVHLFDMGAREYTQIVKAGGSLFGTPVGVALGRDRIYIADSSAATVFALDAKGDLVFAIEDLDRPTGLSYDAGTDRLYVADTVAHRIHVFDADGTRLTSFGGRGIGDGEFNFPTHLSLRAGRLYVNDTMNFRVQVFDLDGRHLASFGRHGDGSGDFAQPKGLGLDREGNVYVADAMFDRVQIFRPDGSFLLAFGGSGSGAGNFWLPAGLFVADNRIYVADSYNRRVQVFEFLGSE